MMTDSTDNTEQKLELPNEDILFKIWLSPRKIFRYLHENKHDNLVIGLIVLFGIFSALDRAAGRSLGDTWSLSAILAFAIVFGGLGALIWYYIYSALMSWTGKWLKGMADTWSIMRVIAHSVVPSLVGSIILILLVIVYGHEFFRSDWMEDNGSIATVITLASIGVQVLLSIWTIVLFVIGVSEIQEFSIGKAILNILLPLILIVVVFGLFFIMLDLFLFG
ncbi:MAG: YIP1 family protein [Saprospirales bacterium]|nr:MAG: YIP1 family protein [Saprospirales bacterium]